MIISNRDILICRKCKYILRRIAIVNKDTPFVYKRCPKCHEIYKIVKIVSDNHGENKI